MAKNRSSLNLDHKNVYKTDDEYEKEFEAWIQEQYEIWELYEKERVTDDGT
jgi:hypothetical protein